MTQATQIDEISEIDILAALSNIQSNPMPSVKTISKSISNNQSSIKLDSSNASDIMELLKQLIDGKTLEISIKVKN